MAGASPKTSPRARELTADNSASPSSKNDAKQEWYDPEEFTLRKRLPRKLPKRKNDVYVSRKTDFKQQIARCQRLLDSGWNEIYIHGLGAAINRAINLALQLKTNGLGSLDVATHTSTVELIDDLEPEVDDAEPETRSRNNSAVHIKVFRPEEFKLTPNEEPLKT